MDKHRHDRVHTLLREDYADGLRCFRNNDFARAAVHFRAADEGADLGDIFQGRYTSFHGLSRVLLGDEAGVKLCRKAAAAETRDAELYYNLALAEQRIGNRERAVNVVRRGLRIDPAHAGLRQLKLELRLHERRTVFHGMPHDHPLNRLLGRLFRGARTGD